MNLFKFHEVFLRTLQKKGFVTCLDVMFEVVFKFVLQKPSLYVTGAVCEWNFVSSDG
jgi:hypothetical protein